MGSSSANRAPTTPDACPRAPTPSLQCQHMPTVMTEGDGASTRCVHVNGQQMSASVEGVGDPPPAVACSAHAVRRGLYLPVGGRSLQGDNFDGVLWEGENVATSRNPAVCCYFRVGSGWFLLFPGGLWMVPLISGWALGGKKHISVPSLGPLHRCTCLNLRYSPASEFTVNVLVTRCENFAGEDLLAQIFPTQSSPPKAPPPPVSQRSIIRNGQARGQNSTRNLRNPSSWAFIMCASACACMRCRCRSMRLVGVGMGSSASPSSRNRLRWWPILIFSSHPLTLLTKLSTSFAKP